LFISSSNLSSSFDSLSVLFAVSSLLLKTKEFGNLNGLGFVIVGSVGFSKMTKRVGSFVTSRLGVKPGKDGKSSSSFFLSKKEVGLGVGILVGLVPGARTGQFH